MSHLVIVGGSDAGISAALRDRELDTGVQVTMIVEDAFPNYSICGLPFYLSGEVPDYRQLAHRTREEITGAGIDLLLDHTAQAVHLRLTGDRRTGRLLGAQMVGPVQTEVAKRIDIIATALFHEMTIEELSDLNLSYTPPLSSPWDLVQMCAQQ